MNRFARHSTFLYLVYDVLQRRQAALGHSFMVKRKDWETVQAAISSLTFDRLAAAAKSILENNSYSDSTIQQLEEQIQSIASQVPQSFARLRNVRNLIRASFVCDAMPAYWLTINPADLRNPLVLILAGIHLSCDELSAEAQRIRRITANMNPVAVAQFFHQICIGIFDSLLGAGTGRIGILGQVSNYFGVVETNGRGMLHLHCLVWLAGNLEFINLKDRLQNDPIFATRMIRYLDSIIKCSVDLAAENLEAQRAQLQPPSAKDPETDEAFISRLHCDSNAVASKRQMHSKNHNRTCFKYAKNGPRECRFLFPRKLVTSTHVDNHGVIQLERNNQWIVPWNPTLSSLLRSNHDINFIPTTTMALGAVYYMTNYATKHDVSRYQVILTTATMKRKLEEAKTSPNPSESQLRIINQNMEKFALRAFYRLTGDREVSGPQAASYLLDLPDYYTLHPKAKIRRLNLGQLRLRFQRIIMAEPGLIWGEEEQTRVIKAKKAPQSLFNHYYWRGPSFSDFCLYEYFKLVDVKSMTQATSRDIRFLPEHPNYDNLIQQYSEKSSAPTFVVTLIGSLSENQPLEDSVRGGHPETLAIQNDLALILLALLVPWNRLPPLFAMFNCTNDSYKEHCAEIWNRIKPGLPHHIQNIAQNIRLLRKCKEDTQIDAALRKEARHSALSGMNYEAYSNNDDDVDNGLDDTLSETAEGTETADGPLDPATLQLAFSIVKSNWTNFDRQDADDIPSLLDAYRPSRLSRADLAHENVSITRHKDEEFGASSDFYNIEPKTLLQWRKKLSSMDIDDIPEDFDVDPNEEDMENSDEPHLSSETMDKSNPLVPITDHERLNRNATILDRIHRLGPNPTGASIAELIKETLSLTSRQSFVVKKILDHAIRHQGKTIVDAQDQLLFYVGGEGGTGKTRVIEAIELGYELLQRKTELLLMAPTGSAAYNIGGRTIHNALALTISDKPRENISSQIYSLWKGKSIMIVDEISMVSLEMLNIVNDQCNKIQALRRDSTAILGGLPIVVFMGDFHQFPPIRALPLWKTETKLEANHTRLIWHRFTNVVILDEQMRQHEDPEFQSLLRRARTGTMTTADVDMLNRRVTQTLPLGGLDCVCVTKTNDRRHHINRVQIERFAEARAQDIYVFPATFSRTKMMHGGLRIDELLGIQDGQGNAKGPGLFLYTRGMPITILYNICTPLGLVNGARGIAAGIVPDPNGMFFHPAESVS